MKVKRIALFTPLHPLKTGIADYIEEMLPYLRISFGEGYVIDIFVDGFKPSNEDTISNHKIYSLLDFENNRHNYDLYIYQIGNNNFHFNIIKYALKYPGVVVLHDFAIHHVMAALYLDNLKSASDYLNAVEENHGKDAKALAEKRFAEGELGLWETDAINYPMNKTIIKGSKGVIAFSQYAVKRIQEYALNVPTFRVFLHCSGLAKRIRAEEKRENQLALGLELHETEPLICVFGFISPPKRPYAILEAARNLKKCGYKFRLVFIGELTDTCKDFPQKIKEAELIDYVELIGFASAEKFDQYVKASDICISLRYPTMGETSGVLMRALRYGKPSIVTRIGTFNEIPEDVAIKISYGESEVEELTKSLKLLIDNHDLADNISEKAEEYAKKFLEPQKTADNFADFIKNIIKFEEIEKNPLYANMRNKVLDNFGDFGNYDELDKDKLAKNFAEIFGGK